MASCIPGMAQIRPTGYVGFGSFHSDNVEHLLAIPEGLYSAPPLPHGLHYDDIFKQVTAEMISQALVPEENDGTVTTFGRPLRKHFFLDASWTFVNHGAFGAACRVAMVASQRWSAYCETQPLRFIDRELFPFVVHAIRRMANLLHSPPDGLVFIPNATYGLNTAIFSMERQLSAGDCVYMLDVGYGSVKKMAADLCQRTGANLMLYSVRFPIANTDEIVAQVRGSMPSNTKLAIFDHVTSNTAIVMPIRELTEIAKGLGAKVIIDGAHGLQSQELHVASLGADWYITNCHKWLCSTKGVAVMYCSASARESTHPRIISHGFGAGYASNFIWDGCRDYGGILATVPLLDWWAAVGHDAAREYCRKLLLRAVELLVTAWGTGTHVPLALYSHMACVELPVNRLPPGAVVTSAEGSAVFQATSLHAKLVQDALHYVFACEVPVKCLEGKLYLRISAAIYNDVDDYARIRDAVEALDWGHLSAI